MEALRVGGLASGLDTNSIIDSLMTAAKQPINRLNSQVNKLTFEKKQYNSITDLLNGLKSALLPLKMESTFKSKIVASSKSDVANAIASVTTPPGAYNIKVSSLASPALASSIYVNRSLVNLGAGVAKLTSSVYPYDQVKGTHNITVKDTGTKWVATDIFDAKSGQKYTKNTGKSVDTTSASALVDANGKTTVAIDETTVMTFTHNGTQYWANIKMDYAVGTSISAIAQNLESQINATIDQNFEDDARQTIAVRTEYDETSGKFNFGFYGVSSTAKVNIQGFFSDISTTPYTPSPVAKALGLTTLDAPINVTQMKSSLVADTSADLQTVMTDSKAGFLPGAVLQFETSGIKEGLFKVYQDSSANSRYAIKSTFYGDTFTKITSATTEAQIKDWLSSPPSAAAGSLFDTLPSNSDIDGTITINGKKIEIKATMSVNEIMAQINSSSAGVKAYYDYENNIFKIENTLAGANDITLGATSDTSKILNFMKVSIPSGSTYIRGQTDGNVDVSAKIKEAGFTTPVDTGVFSINGVSIYIDKDNDTVQDVISKVNRSGAEVTMSYDQATDKFTLTSKSSDKIKLGSATDTSNFLASAGLIYNFNEEQSVGSLGKEAVFSVNGIQYTRPTNEVNDVVNGMNITLAGEGSTVINVAIDNEKAVNAVAAFAAKYNELVEKLSPTEISKEDREKYANELTDEDKANMSDKEVENYQANYERVEYYDFMTRSSELRMLKFSLRGYTQNQVNLPNNKFTSLASLGLTTAGSDSRDIAITKLGFLADISKDKDELAKYIKDNTSFASNVTNFSDDVYKFFADSKTETYVENGKNKTKIVYEGWARTYDTFLVNSTSVTSSIMKKASTNGTIDKQIKDLRSQIATQTTRAENYLERMWAEFSAMEQRVQNMQSQASYLSKIGGGSTAG